MIWTRAELNDLLNRAKTTAPDIVSSAAWPDFDLFIELVYMESGGNAVAVNHNSNNSFDRGLWQINDIHKGEFPLIEALAGGSFTLACYTPIYNAMLAVCIWQKQGYKAWSTYNSLP